MMAYLRIRALLLQYKWNFILPIIGKLFSKDNSAYNYLAESANVFPFGKELCNILQKNAFASVQAYPQTFGVATIYKASK